VQDKTVDVGSCHAVLAEMVARFGALDLQRQGRNGPSGYLKRPAWFSDGGVARSACGLAGLLRLLADTPAQNLMRNYQFDQFQRWHPCSDADQGVRIVDINEASLQRQGQWPWSGSQLASLLDRLLLQGKRQPLAVFGPPSISHQQTPGREAQSAPLSDYLAAFEAMQRLEPQALEMFAQLAHAWPDDPLVRLHQGRLRAGESADQITLREK
jgi:hypothetical protein